MEQHSLRMVARATCRFKKLGLRVLWGICRALDRESCCELEADGWVEDILNRNEARSLGLTPLLD